MNTQDEIKIPNTDFANSRRMVSLSFRKVDGGFYMKENFSGKEYAISNTGQIHATINDVGKSMLMILDTLWKDAKKNDVNTIEFQIKKGGLSFLFGNGMIGLDMSNQETTLITHIMNSVVYVLNINPSLFGGKKYKTNKEGYIMFIEDLKKLTGNRPFVSGNQFVNDTPFIFGDIQEVTPQNYGQADFIEVVTQDENLSSTDFGEQVTSKGTIRV